MKISAATLRRIIKEELYRLNEEKPGEPQEEKAEAGAQAALKAIQGNNSLMTALGRIKTTRDYASFLAGLADIIGGIGNIDPKVYIAATKVFGRGEINPQK